MVRLFQVASDWTLGYFNLSMYDQQAFDRLKTFLETHSASLSAVRFLKANVDVGVVINQNMECTFFKGFDGKPHFEKRRPFDPDLIFFLSPESIDSLVHGPHETLADVVRNITKNYLAGTLKIKLAGPWPNLILRGYWSLLKSIIPKA